ncbi:hypothetical protein SteCoe_35518 [Stentor coeruleus]|uniref:Vesicle transport protein n=1 Tax=Stentor coeruleus TaxID=5963 RepID=A0A1R2AS26_9CILI|nr:hypothetical protein SteCoe_35518 [Stentor coeruleus]
MSKFFNFEQDSRTLNDENDESCLPALSFKERVIAFLTCFGLSLLINIVSFGAMIGLLTGNPIRYALSFTLGNILSLVGTGFLLGFKRQMKSAFDEKRRFTTIIFFTAMALTLISVFFFNIPLLILLFVVIQICSYVWYMASYFPWGREILSGCFKKCCGRCVEEH